MTEQASLTAGHDTPIIAAIDIGSNSFHLIISRVVEGTLQPLSKQKIPVQLAAGLDHHNRLSEEAIERGLAALKSFSFALNGLHSTDVRIIATYTLRKATNSDEFLKRAERFLEYPMEIVSGEEEARLIYEGVAHTQSNQQKRLVIDIGGGSTELIVGNGFEIEELRSINMGCVTFTREYFANGNITESAMLSSYQAALERLSLCSEVINNTQWQAAIGCSGSIKAILNILIKLKLERTKIHRSSLLELQTLLITQGHHENLAELMLTPERARTIAAGVTILMALFDSLNISDMVLSDAALREGVLYTMDSRLHNIDIRKRSIDGIAKRYYVDHAQANRVKDTALALINSVIDNTHEEYKEIILLLSSSALVHEIGLHIHTRGYHNHSAYILSHSDLPGFNQQQINGLEWLVKHCRKRFNWPLDEHANFSLDDEVMFRLCVALRMAIILNQKRQDNLLPSTKLSFNGHEIRLIFPEAWLDDKTVIETALTRESEYLKRTHYQLTVVYS